MVIVSGKLYLRPGSMGEFLEESMKAVRLARTAPGCSDFVVAADPLESDRVNIYEEWETEIELQKFRADGPEDALSSKIKSAHVTQRVVE